MDVTSNVNISLPSAWQFEAPNICATLSNVADALKQWKFTDFGNIHHRKKG